MKRLMILLLVALLVLSGCAPLPPEPTEIETEPSSPSLETVNSFGEETAPTQEEEIIYVEFAGPFFMALRNTENRDEEGAYLVYSGGEMQIDYSYAALGMEEEGLGVYLFLDGQPQPFRVEEGGELAYVHTLYPGNKHTSPSTFYFTPTLGQNGDMPELTLYCEPAPNHIRGNQKLRLYFREGTCSADARLKFEADPPEAELPETEPEKSLLSWSISYEELDSDLVEMDIMPTTVFAVNGAENTSTPKILYNVKSQDILELRYEIFGCPEGQFSLTFLLNGQPVSVLPEDWISLTTQAGQKTVVTAQVNIGEFEDLGKIRAVCLRRNGSDRMDSTSNVVYLSSAEGYTAHEKLVNGEE